MGNSVSLADRVERARKTGSVTYSEDKKEIPKAILQLTNLHSLDLNDNALSHLPPALFQLAKLKTLSVCRNRLVCGVADLSDHEG